MTMPAPIRALAIAALVLLVGAAVLQGTRPDGRADPIASVDNGGPRGLLLWRLLLTQAGVDVAVWESDPPPALTSPPSRGDEPPLAHVTVVVPPPERTGFQPAEVEGLFDLAARGARLVVLCDGDNDRNKRLGPLLRPHGLACVGNPDVERAFLLETTGGIPGPLLLRDGAVITVSEEATDIIPLVHTPGAADLHADAAAAVVAVALGAGHMVVVSSTTMVSNDGLPMTNLPPHTVMDGADAKPVPPSHAAFAAWLIDDATVVIFDQRHHVARGRALWLTASARGPGPVVLLLCVALLVPLTVLAFAPREGELLDDDDLLIGTDRVTALAALLARAGLTPSSSPSPSSSSSSPSSALSSVSSPSPSPSSSHASRVEKDHP